MQILVAEPEYFSAVLPRLMGLGEVVHYNIDKSIGTAEILVIRSRTKIDKSLLDKATNLKVIATATTGLDHIDVEECGKRGIKILDAAGANAEAVAEFTAGLMISLARKMHYAHTSASKGEWKREDFVQNGLGGKALGLIGFGRIGRLVCKIAKAFGMNVLAYDPYVEEKLISDNGAMPLSLEQLLGRGDFVSVHCNLGEDTRNLIDERRIRMMKPSAFLINTSRGGIIDEYALLKALKEKRIAGAALDVFEEEPLRNQELIKYARENANLVITPHIAGLTKEAVDNAAEIICKKLEDELGIK
ncbi:MAG: 3-phosphoglycerate dehydrogenase [Candidatus Aenigmarchaeota archaeon]|nr:3-phosphoglycerate dehydrogenase [Candidatus Aenigmarchaeota archaeon]